jgi:hypothetical protein
MALDRGTGGRLRRGRLALLLLPLLAGGCGSASSTSVQATPSSAATPWIINYAGSAPPTPVPTISYSSPAPFPTGFLPLPSATSPTPTPSGSDCANIKFNGGQINSAGVVAGTTSATVTWYNPGGSDLVQYRVTAISQNLVTGSQRDVGWTVVTPGAGCGMLSAPVTGLDRKTNYVFSVDAVWTKIGEDGTWAKTIARSVPVKTN